MDRVKQQKVIFNVPMPLLVRVDKLVDELQMSRSEFIRVSVEEKLDRFERERLDKELREGYEEMDELRRRDHRNFTSSQE